MPALIADRHRRRTKAGASAASTMPITDKDGGATAPDTFMRAVIALAAPRSHAGNKQKALDAISVGDNCAELRALQGAARQHQEGREAGAAGHQTAAAGAAGRALRPRRRAQPRRRRRRRRALPPDRQYARSRTAPTRWCCLATSAEKQEQLDARHRLLRAGARRFAAAPHLRAAARPGTCSSAARSTDARTHLKALIDADPSDFAAISPMAAFYRDAKDFAGDGRELRQGGRGHRPMPSRKPTGASSSSAASPMSD